MDTNFIKLFLSLFLFSLMPTQVFAAFEVGGDFSYKKTVYGSERQNEITTRTYSASYNLFLFGYTSLELNYSYTDDITTENNEIPIDGTTVSIIGTQNRINRQVFGIGLRQFFAPRGSFIRPSLSLGYANQVIEDQTDITFRDNSTGETAVSQGDVTKRREDSVFGTFALKFQMTKTLSVDASVNTVFKAFEFDRAQDSMRYSIGLSWLFL